MGLSNEMTLKFIVGYAENTLNTMHSVRFHFFTY